MGLLGEMKVAFTSDTSNLVSGAGVVRNVLTGLAQSGFTGAIVDGFAIAGAAAVGFSAISVKTAADFQQSVLKIQAYAGLTGQQAQDMSNKILQMATAVGQSPKALADALYPIISSGYSASQALDILDLSARSAAASGAQTSVVADALTTSLKSMHAPASQAGQYMDMLNKMVSIGKGELPQYANVIGKLSLAAGSAKVPFADMGAALATLTTHGFPSVAQASTSLGNLFTQIGPKIDNVAAKAKSLKLNFDENAFSSMSLSDKIAYLNQVTDGNQGEILKLLGGSNLALKAFNALSGSTQDYASNLNAMQHAQGATANAFQTASQGFNFSMQQMQASIQVLEVKVGSALLPVLTQLVQTVAPIISSFANWLSSSGALTIAANVMIGALKGLASAVSGIITFFKQNKLALDLLEAVLITVAIFIAGALISAFVGWAIAAGAAAIATLAAIWPILLIGAVIAAAVAIIIIVVQNWGAIWGWLKGVWQEAPKFFAELWLGIQLGITAIWDWIQNAFHTAVNAVLNFVRANWPFLLAILTGPLGLMIGFVIKFWPQIHDMFNAGIRAVQNILSSIGGTLYNIFIQPFVNAYNYISGIFRNISNLIGNVTSSVRNALHSVGIPGFAGGVQNFSGGWAMVGETGPELVYLPQGSNVYPSGTGPNGSQSASVPTGSVASTGATTGGEQHIYIELDGKTLAHVIGNQQARIVRVRQNRRVA